MKFEEPEESFVWPPKARISHIHLFGAKCYVRLIPSEDGIWWEMGGQRIEKHDTDAGDSLEVDASGGDGDEALDDYIHIGLLGEEYCVDKRQARVYYRFNATMQKHECRIMLPNDFHFRRSRKGKIEKRSKSFMKDGMPRPEVLLLYAMKTQELMDRRIAVETFPEKMWGAQDLGELFRAMDKVSISHKSFCTFAGNWLTHAASRPGGLAEWAAWEKVADAAYAEYNDTAKNLNNLNNKNTHVQFLRFLEEAVKEHRGIPAQSHVRNKFNWKPNVEPVPAQLND